MAEKLLTKFAKENFGNSKYIPLLHGRCPSVKPSVLMIKRKRAWWKKPFYHSELISLSELEKYVDDKCKKFYVDVAEGLLKKSEKKLQKKEIAEVVSKHDVKIIATEHAKLECKANCTMGDLELGTIDEEYYEDSDVRDLLHNAILSDKKISPYKNQKLYMVTGVIYSSMFKIIGKRESSIDIAGQFNMKSKLGGWIKDCSLRGGCSAIKCKAALVSRKKKGPFLFTVSRVEYDEKNKKLKLPDNVFVGKVIPRGRGSLENFEDKNDELVDVTEDDQEEEEQLVSELLKIENLNDKLEVIQRLLVSVKTKEEKEALVVKYLCTIEGMYIDGPYISKNNEKDFFTEVGFCLDENDLGTHVENILQNVQDYWLILKFIAGRSQGELHELNAILNEDK